MKKVFSILVLFLIVQSIFSLSYGKTINEDSLLVFVGDINSVTLLKKGGVNTIEHDDIQEIVITKNSFSIESNISKILFGKYKNKSIKFNIYDEFEDPMCKNYNHALFILKKDKDSNWNQVSWLYYDVCETTKGDWIIPYTPYLNVDKEFFENNMQLIELKEGGYISGISVDDFWKYFSKERIPKIQALK